jgi:hypothetical protein
MPDLDDLTIDDFPNVPEGFRDYAKRLERKSKQLEKDIETERAARTTAEQELAASKARAELGDLKLSDEQLAIAQSVGMDRETAARVFGKAAPAVPGETANDGETTETSVSSEETPSPQDGFQPAPGSSIPPKLRSHKEIDFSSEADVERAVREALASGNESALYGDLANKL